MRLLDRLREPGGFLRSAAILLSGTAAAHLITALTLPILTRLYTPTDFSTLAVFSSVLFILSSVACLRLEIAIPMPRKDAQAFRLLVLCMVSLGVFFIISAVVVLIIPGRFFEIIKIEIISPYVWLLPAGILFTGGISVFQNWFVRKKEFSLMAKSKVVQSATSSVSQVLLSTIGTSGLLVGYMLNAAMGCIALGYKFLKKERVFLNYKKLPATLYVYKDFPKYSTWETLANNMAIQVPVIMIAALAVKEEAGHLLLAMSIMQAPMALFGNAVAQVYLSHAGSHYQKKALGSFSVDVLCELFKIGVGPLLAVGMVSPFLVPIIFGSAWERSGWLIAWMTPWFIFQFLASPISMGIHVAGKQKIAFFLQIFGVLFRVMAVVISSVFFPGFISESYAVSGAAFYFFYLCLILKIVGSPQKKLIDSLKSCMNYFFCWVVGSLMAGYTLYLVV